MRTRTLEGLSFTTQVAWTISWALWLLYSARVGAWPKFGAEVVGLACDLILLIVVAVTCVQQGGTRPPLTATWWIWVAALGLVGVYRQCGVVAFAVGLAVFDAVSVLPQLRQTLTAASLDGLSLGSWFTRGATAAGWATYGFAIGRPEAGGWAFVMAPIAVFVCVRIVLDRRPRPAVDAHA